MRDGFHRMSPPALTFSGSFSYLLEVEKPQEVIHNHQKATGNEVPRCEAYDRKGTKVKQVNQVASYGEQRVRKR